METEQDQGIGMEQDQGMGMEQDHEMGMEQDQGMGMEQDQGMGMEQDQGMEMDQSHRSTLQMTKASDWLKLVTWSNGPAPCPTNTAFPGTERWQPDLNLRLFVACAHPVTLNCTKN